MAREDVESCEGYQVCIGSRGICLPKSCDVKRVKDAGRVLNTGGTENCCEGGKEKYIYSSCCDRIHIL
jgi:hypothetical protein